MTKQEGTKERSTVRDSATVAGWTLVSRLTGLVRVVIAGAVLGPTFFGNVVQTTYILPSLIYSSVAGPVLAMVVVPVVTRAVRQGGADHGRFVLAGISYRVLLLAAAAAGLLMLLSPLVARLLTAGIPAEVTGPDATGNALVLVLFVGPQVLLYSVAALAIAAQQTQGRFAISAGGPAVENVGLVLTVVAAGAIWGHGLEVDRVPLDMALFLGVGSTLAVAAHAALQLLGAARCGRLVRPSRAAARDAQAADSMRRLLRSSGVALWPSLSMLVVLGAAGTVAGGVLVAQMIYAVHNAVSYLTGRAVGIAALPRLAAAAAGQDGASFAAAWRRSTGYAVLASTPILVLLAVLAPVLAPVLAQGRFAEPTVLRNLTIGLVVVAVAQLLGGLHEMGRQALFADGRETPALRASEAAFAATLGIAAAAVLLVGRDDRIPLLLLAVAAAELVGALVVSVAMRRVVGRHAVDRRAVVRIVGGAAVMAPFPVAAVWWAATTRPHPFAAAAVGGIAALVALVCYAAVVRHALVERPGQERPALQQVVPREGTPGQGGPTQRGPGGPTRTGTARRSLLRRLLRPASGASVWGTAALLSAGTAFLVTRFGWQVGVAAVGVLGASALFVATVRRPVVGTYAYLATLPLIAGIDRGNLLPLVRPNEALLALVLAAAALGGYLRLCRGDPWPLRPRRVDAALGGFLLLSTVWPIASLMLRGQTPNGGDLAAVLPICKLVALYLLVRLSVTTDDQVARCLRLVIWPATAVAVIAVLQTLEVGPVVWALQTVWSPDATAGAVQARGTTTLSSPIATGDVIIIAAVLVVVCAVRNVLPRRELIIAGAALSCGVLAAGQFSTWISAAVAVVLLLRTIPQLRYWARRALPLLPLPFLIGAPAVMGRLADFGATGVPVSWQGRWDNLSNFYLPAFEPINWLIGVSPDPVLAAPETWREVIYLEAGYLAFVWIGGLPLLVAFGWLSVVVLRTVVPVLAADGPTGAAAMTLRIAWIFLLVLTVLDPHLTLRGTGDLLFTLLALTLGSLDDRGSRRTPQPAPLAASGVPAHRRAVGDLPPYRDRPAPGHDRPRRAPGQPGPRTVPATAHRS